MKRLLSMALILAMILAVFAGCKKDTAVDPTPYFSLYPKVTALYGTKRMETPEALGFDLQQVENISDNRWGFPLTESYAGLTFDFSAMFSGPDYLFSGTYLERSYTYPDDKDKLIFDTVALCTQLSRDFGPATDTSYFYNWVEVMLGEQWNEDIKFWQDAWVMERVVDAQYAGSLLVWDLTSVADPAVLQALRSAGKQRLFLVCSLHIDDYNHVATLTITY